MPDNSAARRFAHAVCGEEQWVGCWAAASQSPPQRLWTPRFSSSRKNIVWCFIGEWRFACSSAARRDVRLRCWLRRLRPPTNAPGADCRGMAGGRRKVVRFGRVPDCIQQGQDAAAPAGGVNPARIICRQGDVHADIRTVPRAVPAARPRSPVRRDAMDGGSAGFRSDGVALW